MKHGFLLIVLTVCSLILRASGPVAKNDTVTIHENSQLNINITTLVTDATGGPLTVSIAFPALNGSATASGSNLLYQPPHGFFGVDSFKYRVCDTAALCATAEIYINIQGTNLPPVVVDDNYNFADTVRAAVLDVLANDADPGHDTLYVAAVGSIDSSGNLGSLSLDSATGHVLFSHTPLTCGSKTFEYIVCNLSQCDTGMVTVNITCPDSIFTPQGFSPNGDGKNDLLVFRGLEYFAPSSITVFNRYGTTVYQNSNYLNDWDGTDMDSHHALPDGTYFFVLTLSNGRTYNNYVIINR